MTLVLICYHLEQRPVWKNSGWRSKGDLYKVEMNRILAGYPALIICRPNFRQKSDAEFETRPDSGYLAKCFTGISKRPDIRSISNRKIYHCHVLTCFDYFFSAGLRIRLGVTRIRIWLSRKSLTHTLIHLVLSLQFWDVVWLYICLFSDCQSVFFIICSHGQFVF